MKKAWSECRASGAVGHFETHYSEMLGKIEGLGHSAEDVEKFMIALVGFQNEGNFSFKAGLFLSALINGSPDTGFVINTYHLSEPIHLLGYRNTKDVVVNGGAGDGLGCLMDGGTMIVNGHVGDVLADRMKRGSITVNGNTGNWAADEMEGGELHIHGVCTDISALFKGGKIYLGGVLFLFR